ncbi:MAG TPA: helix-turn-helix domain-containing protein [Candidatus Thermoplasmatota archaeon]|nr:helix-turn-helix domain-containing protein [Candidatus Thermoplasmatota archaeon]
MPGTLRELRYRLDAKPGAAPRQLPLQLAAAAPGLTVETTVAHLDDAGDVWRILGAHGPPAAVEAALSAFEAYTTPFVREKQVLGRSERRLILWYKYRADASRSHTALAFRMLGRDTVVTDRTRAGSIAVRILCRAGPAVQRYLRAVREGTPETAFRLLYLGPPQEEPEVGLTPLEQETLRAAWELGYYRVPRRAGVREVAQQAGLSASAAGYRLRRAEAKLVAAHLGQGGE